MQVRPPDETLLEPLLVALVDRAHRATLHRLRGIAGVLVGWAEIGLGADERARLMARREEMEVLFARLDWLRLFLTAGPTLERVRRGAAPEVLFAAALGTTPEEMAESLPCPADDTTRLGCALWLQAVAPPERAPSLRVERVAPGVGSVRVAPDPPPPPEAWRRAFPALAANLRGGELRFPCLDSSLQERAREA